MNKAKEELLEQKENPKVWNDSKQARLDELVVLAVDLEELISSKEAEAKVEAEAKEEIPANVKHLAHLVICKGRRFNPNTGKEETKPYTQTFTASELRIFLAHYKVLGYQILKVLHNPTNIEIK